MPYDQSIQRDQSSPGTWILAGIGVVVAAAVAVPPQVLAITVAALLGIVLLASAAFPLLRGNAGPLAIGWVLLFPLGYYFFSIPRAHPIVTLDRLTILALLVAAAFATPNNSHLPAKLRTCGRAW